MTLDYRSIAQAATPGPWTHRGTDVLGADDFCIAETNIYSGLANRDSAFMATFDPPTVLGLLNRIEELTEVLTDRTRELVTLENAAHDVVNEWGTRDEDWIRPTFDGAIDRLRGVLAVGGDTSNPPTQDDEWTVRIPADPEQRAALAKFAGLTDDEKAALDQWCHDEEQQRARGVLMHETETRADGSFPEPKGPWSPPYFCTKP